MSVHKHGICHIHGYGRHNFLLISMLTYQRQMKTRKRATQWYASVKELMSNRRHV